MSNNLLTGIRRRTVSENTTNYDCEAQVRGALLQLQHQGGNCESWLGPYGTRSNLMSQYRDRSTLSRNRRASHLCQRQGQQCIAQPIPLRVHRTKQNEFSAHISTSAHKGCEHDATIGDTKTTNKIAYQQTVHFKIKSSTLQPKKTYTFSLNRNNS